MQTEQNFALCNLENKNCHPIFRIRFFKFSPKLEYPNLQIGQPLRTQKKRGRTILTGQRLTTSEGWRCRRGGPVGKIGGQDRIGRQGEIGGQQWRRRSSSSSMEIGRHRGRRNSNSHLVGSSFPTTKRGATKEGHREREKWRWTRDWISMKTFKPLQFYFVYFISSTVTKKKA